jgi:hypothetical protein
MVNHFNYVNQEGSSSKMFYKCNFNGTYNGNSATIEIMSWAPFFPYTKRSVTVGGGNEHNQRLQKYKSGSKD